MTQIDYFEIAKKVVKDKYPSCDGALMAGSIVRGEGTITSDIDLVVFDDDLDSAYRESYYFDGVPVEAFVHSKKSFEHYFDLDCKNKTPSLPFMVIESVVIQDNKYFDELKHIANEIYQKGPGWKPGG